MSPRITSALTTCLLAVSTSVHAFTPSSTSTSTLHRNPPSSATTNSPLSAASSSIPITEESYPILLSQASLCANSEECSLESANLYLKEIVHVQSGCAAGTLSGNAVCEDVIGVSEVVAALREKVGSSVQQQSTHDGERVLNSAALATLYAVVSIAIMSLAATSTTTTMGVVPFTAQEIWWSIRDGYAMDLVSHYFHNGGLLVGDAMSQVRGLSPQELLWSIKDGYVMDTLGGDGMGGVETVPFTPQEVWWAVKDGYATDMIGHWFRNGGL